MHPNLEKHLGQSLSVKEVARYLNCSVTTIRRNYKSLGGIRIGMSYRFFEKRLIDAVLRQTEEKMDRSNPISKQKVQIITVDQNSSQRVGSQKTKRNGSPILSDEHNLLD